VRTIKDRKVYSVSEVNYFAKEMLEQMIVWVEGEVSKLDKHPSLNFYYLSLKDDKANMPCIVNGYVVDSLNYDILNQKIMAFGNLTLYEPFGKYQLRIQRLELYGEGDLYKKLEDLIIKLRKEGLFDPRHKKEIPLYPKRICLITSRGSDAWSDFKTHSIEKFPSLELVDIDTRVQGPIAIKNLLRVLPLADTGGFDVVVITRGGGSIEDLAAFNDESVARAIFNMKTPTVVAIGHEANESLAEWVADLRASTPTDAAHTITRGWQNVLEKLDRVQEKLSDKRERLISFNLERLDYIYKRLDQSKILMRQYPFKLSTFKETLRRHESVLISGAQKREKELYTSFIAQSKFLTEKLDNKLITLYHTLQILSPKKTLERGYSITTAESGRVVKDVADIVIGDTIAVKLFRGALVTKVKSKFNEKTS
jgi:exodeoxyribonuclease VII large subunit